MAPVLTSHPSRYGPGLSGWVQFPGLLPCCSNVAFYTTLSSQLPAWPVSWSSSMSSTAFSSFLSGELPTIPYNLQSALGPVLLPQAHT